MRSEVKVLWFDDDTTSETVPYLKEQCNEIFKNKGYKCEIDSFIDYDNALTRLRDNERIDMIFTDFNVSENDNKDGVSFYLSARQGAYYKQHIIIYSTDDQNVIRDAIKSAMDFNELSDFSNFSFFKVNLVRPQDAISQIEKCVDIYLSRWKELNALRGRTMNEHADLEFQLKQILGPHFANCTYEKTINEFKKLINDPSKDTIFTDWHDKRSQRNDYAHVEEGRDGAKYFIMLKNGKKIYESDIEVKRKELLTSVANFQELIDNYTS